MQHWFLARDYSRTVKEILNTTRSLGCNGGVHHPHEIIDDVNSGVVDCLAT